MPQRDPLSAAVDPRVDLRRDDDRDTIVQRLSGQKTGAGRYEIEGEISRGGQGAVFRVRDPDLRRELAMKVAIVPGEKPGDGSGAPPTDPRTLGRFLEEAQVTAQLDHPGIVPIHELGLDDEGRVYFTMKLVRGRELKEIFELAHEGRDGWTTTRVLGLLLKVCEAMAYAHFKGVVHRDLKPANVMVGRFGAVYVMDWGIARVLDREDSKDVRIDADVSHPTLELDTDRRREAIADDSPLLTKDGDVIGTPAYMSPEQALGRLDEIGPWSDVYALGAMLYHLLAGHAPYVPRGAKVNALAVWNRVQEGPPRSVGELAPEVPGELIAICDKAMAREPSSRYASMDELAADLRAYLEGRVVQAYGGGAWVEARKWVQRNRALALASAAALLLALGGLGAVGWVQAQGRAEADAQRAVATRRAEDVLRLSALEELDDLRVEADALWPAVPERVDAYVAWLARARDLLDQLPGHVAKRDELRVLAESGATRQDRWWEAQLTKLVDGLSAFDDPLTGCVAGASVAHGWGIERRLAFARTVEGLTLTGDVARARWAEAVASIADREQCPAYDGLTIEPQLGLLPIGRDPASGLWEFWHLQSGDEPSRDGSGRLQVNSSTGIVLVLLPAGRFWMGAQADDPKGRNFDRDALAEEGPVHEVAVSPVLISKFEVTQAQWERFTNENPSYYGPGGDWDTWSREPDDVSVHPVEQVSWDAAQSTLGRMGLQLPTEAQWEYAARAGSTSPWWTGPRKTSLVGAANVSDAWRRDHGGRTNWDFEDWDDGHAMHAAVGSGRPNAFGLYDTIGNVWEWCVDTWDVDFYASGAVRDPVSRGGDAGQRVFRGGSFYDAADECRVSNRNINAPGGSYDDIGLRPARALAGPP